MRLKSWALDLPVDSSSPMVLTANSGTSRNSSSTTPQVKSRNPCFNFAKGSCRFGETCRYLHDATARSGTNLNGSTRGRDNSDNTTKDLLQKLLHQLSSMNCNSTVSKLNSLNTMPVTITTPAYPSSIPRGPLQSAETLVGPSSGSSIPTPTVGSTQPTGQPTILPHAFLTKTLWDLNNGDWNMDIGASSHLNASSTYLSNVFNTCLYPSVSVGDGYSIPVTNTGHSILPTSHGDLHLRNVLITPSIIKNLIYVRQFVRDNNCTIEFDGFGFYFKDFTTLNIRGINILDIQEVLRRLISSSFVSCNKEKPPVLCHACQLGKHVRLPFVKSETVIDDSYDPLPQPKPSTVNTHPNQQSTVHITPAHSLPIAPAQQTITQPVYHLSSSSLAQPSHSTEAQHINSTLVPTPNDLTPAHLLPTNTAHHQSPLLDLFNEQATLEATVPSNAPNQNPVSTRPMVTRSQVGTFHPLQCLSLHVSSVSRLPKSYRDAFNDPNWQNAMQDEYNALINNKTWTLVPRPPDINIVCCMWLFRLKYLADGTPSRYKARLVANGSTRIEGADVDETFSPVMKPGTIRTVLSLATSRHWPIHQIDVKNAFLHGDLSETVYMHQPQELRDHDHPDYVCLLQWSLYGLKQAPRAWFQRFSSYITRVGFSHSRCDSSLFICRQGTNTAYLLLYVDDIVLTASSEGLLQRIIHSLHQEFAMTDLDPLNYFLGISVTRDSLGLFLSQKKYAVKILERAHMVTCNPCRTPIDTESKLGCDCASVSDLTLYRSLAGSLQYLTFTRSDISYAVQQVCLYMHDPREPHFSALKRILRYVQGTLDYGLQLFSSSTTDLVAYSDADWAGCPTTRRSTLGYCVFLCNNLLSWSSKRQRMLSHSSAEAEYHGVANAVAETCWLRNLLRELHSPLSSATLVYYDNINLVAARHVRVFHVPSRYQFSDIFTKGLPSTLFEEFRSSLSVRSPPTPTAGEQNHASHYKFLPRLSLASKQAFLKVRSQNGEGGAACFAPMKCGKMAAESAAPRWNSLRVGDACNKSFIFKGLCSENYILWGHRRELIAAKASTIDFSSPPPRHFGRELREKLVSKLMKDVEGTCSGRHGFVVAITGIEDIGKWIIRDGTRFVTFLAKYLYVVFRPFKEEILEATVTIVNKVIPEILACIM
ncbi:ribonuclease H-like domain-containing protein [Tanacetum coccineum]